MKRRTLFFACLLYIVPMVVFAQTGSCIIQGDTTICPGQTVTLGAFPAQGICSKANLPANLQQGLVAFYPFCGNANDESGNGNDGMAVGAILTTDRFGNDNAAYSFDGINDYIGLSQQLTDMTEITFSAWVNYQGNTNSFIFSDLTPTFNEDYWFGFGSSNSIWIRADKSGKQLNYSGNQPNLNLLNLWKHITWKMLPTYSEIYIDGILVMTVNQGGSNIGNHAINPTIGAMGHTLSTLDWFFHGTIDDICIHNRGLSAIEIQQLYDVGSNTYLWSTGDTTSTISVSPTQTTTYTLTVTTGTTSCMDTITVNVLNIDAGANDTICMGDSVQLQASGGLIYNWTPITGLSNPNSSNPYAHPTQTTMYYVNAESLGANLVNNGDFELGNSGFITNYTYCNTYNCLGPLADNGYSVGNNANFFHSAFSGIDHTTGNGKFMIINGGNPSLIVWKQTIQIQPNTNYAFGVWISTMITSGLPAAQIRFSINGIQLGPTYNAPNIINYWDQVYITWNSGLNTAATIEIVDVLPISSGNDFGLDDIFFSELITCFDSIKVTVVNPTQINLGNDTLLCKGEILELSVPAGVSPVLWSTGATSPSISVNTSGVYWVQGTTASGCVVSDTITVNFLNPQIHYGLPNTNIQKRIYYLKGTTSPYTLYSANMNGTGETLIATGVVDASFGNGKIAFHNGSIVYIVNGDGTNLSIVPNTNDNPVELEISKDGTKICYTGTANNYKLFTINSDGSNKILFNDGSLTNEHQSRPTWKEAGKIYFDISNLGNAYTQKIYSKPENSPGSPPTQLTTVFGQNPISGGPGNKVTFNGTSGILYMMNSDGSNVTQLTNAGNVAWGGVWDADTLYYTSNGNIGKIRSNNTDNSIIINDGNIVKVIGIHSFEYPANDTTICKGESVILSANSTIQQNICSKSQLPANLQQGLVAYYPFCGNANDESGNGNNGTVNGAALTTDRYGQTNSAYSFDGLNHEIDINPINLTNFPLSNSERTISAWVKLKTGGCVFYYGDDQVAALGNTPGTGIGNYVFIDQIHYDCYYISGLINNVLDTSQWYLVSYTYAGGNIIKNYINGQYIGDVVLNGVLATCSTGHISIGTKFDSYNAYQWPFNGKIDDVNIYNRVLSNAEIQQLYNLGISNSTASSYLWSTGDTTQSITATLNQTTTYTLTVTNGNISCTDTITVNVLNPQINNGQDTTICKGDSVELHGFSNYSSDWEYFEDFEGTPETEWSEIITFPYNNTLVSGPFGNSSQNLNLINLPTHDSIEINFDLYIHDSWDGNSWPDYWDLLIDNDSIIHTTFGSYSGISQSFPDNYPATNPVFSGAFNSNLPIRCSNIVPSALYKIAKKIIHFSNNLHISFIGNNLQSICDESFSLDNVHIKLKNSNAGSFLWSTGDTTQNITVSPSQTTTYYLTISCNGVSCVDSVKVTVPQNPAQLVQDTSFCAGNASLITATAGYSAYVWSTGETTQSIQPANTGWYWVEVPNSGGCAFRDSCYVNIFPLPLDIGDTLKPGDLPMIAWYPLDKDGLDYSGNNNHGIPMNTYWFEPGIVDSCIHLVGQGYMTSAGGHVLLPDLELDTLDGFTISLWAYEIGMSHSDGEAYIMFGDHSNGNIGIGHFGVSSLNSLQFSTANAQFAPGYLNNWVKYTLSYQNLTYKGYINDSLVTSGSGPANAWGTKAAIGRHWWYNNSATSSRFIGKIDDVRIYGGSYCPQEIRSLEDTLLLSVQLQASNLCMNDSAKIDILNPQPHIQYQLINPITGQSIGSAVFNQCDSIIHLVTSSLSNSISLQILARDTVYGCERMLDSTFVITVHPNPSVFLGNDTAYCSNSGINLTAQTGFNQYLWSTGSTSSSTTASTSGIYWLEVSNSFGCKARDSIQITLKPIPVVNINPALVSICEGDNQNLSAQSNLTGTSWIWNTSATSSSITISPTTSTTYYITGTVNGCVDTAQSTITVKPKPIAQIQPTNPVICFGDSVLITASSNLSGASYAWSTGLTSASFWTGSLGTTGYIVTVTNDGCQDSASVFVTVNSIPMISVSPATSSICAGDSLILTAVPIPAGGSFLWSTGAGGNTITVFPTGSTANYSLLYTYSGCSNSDTVEIQIHPVPTVSINPMNPAICSGDTLILNAQSSVPGVSWQWNTGQQLASDTVVVTGGTTFSVTATLNGCTDHDSSVVSVQAPPLISISPASPVICQGDSLQLTASSIPLGSTFTWNNGATGPTTTIFPVMTTAYTVTATAGLCTRDTSIQVLVKPLPTGVIHPADTTVCKGDSIYITASSDIPGSTFHWTFGDTAQQVLIVPFMSSYYYLIVEADNCLDTASAHISVRDLPEFSLGPDGYYCEGEQLMLNGPTGNFSYLWQDNTILQSYAVTAPGEYWLIVDDDGCRYTDSISLSECSEIWVPNAFTPNGDQLNDVFKPKYNEISQYELYIYSRWGELLFESTDPETGWDGTFKGSDSPAGVYYYLILYKGVGNIYNGVNHKLQGVVSLVR